MNQKQAKKYLTYLSGAAFIIAFILKQTSISETVVNIFYIISMLSGGYFVVAAAIKGLVRQRFLNINFLVTIAAIGALYINQWAEAAAVIFFFSLAEFFEEFGVERSRKALEALVHKTPQTATLKNGSKVGVDDVALNEIITVRPGELIPLDGIVVKGLSAVDEATITGESIPQDKHEGSNVFASTLNQQGYLEIKVTKVSKDSTFAKIVTLVEQAQRSRAPAQDFVDTFAKYYTPSVVAVSFFIAVVPPLLFQGDFMTWLYRALVLLVIACPCALVISTPVSIASAIGGASRRGVLIKGGKYLELLSKIKAVAFDKTKTLTMGEPYISDVVVFNGFTEQEVLADAAGIELFSSHPLSKSITKFVESKGITPHTMDKYQNFAGKGGQATCLVCHSREHCIGNLKYIGAKSETTKEVLEKSAELEAQGKTVVLISEGSQVMGALGITDKIRPEAAQAVDELKRKRISSTIVTGDNQHSAEFVAKRLGIQQVFASLLPDEKVEKVKELKVQLGFVAMVGDGVNDAPSLATASVGIAMGAGGSDVAIETADIALMNNNLTNIPYATDLGKRTVRTIKQNLTAALAVKAFFLLLALFGFTHLEYAIGADSGVAILVILNGLRLFSV